MTDDLLALYPFLGRLQDRHGSEARCPAHDDTRASLTIGTGQDGRLLLRCHAGCTFDAICRALGIEPRQCFPPQNGNGHYHGKRSRRPGVTIRYTPTGPQIIEPNGRQVVATYDYRGTDGTLLYQVVRYAPKDFRQRRPDGQGGWIWSLKGVTRVLYRLPELVAADTSATVYIVEGEKDVDRLRALGLLATTCPQGAQKWDKVDDSPMHGRSVVILPDADEPGRQHAEQVARALAGKAASVKILALPGLPEKGDVSDWIDQGGTAEQLASLAAECEEWAGAEQNTTLCYEFTDLGNAQRLVDQHSDTIRYCHPHRKWYCWTGNRWQADQTGEIGRLAKQTVLQIHREADGEHDRDHREAIFEHAIRSQSAARIKAMIELARSEENVVVRPEDFDQNQWLLNCPNGTVDLRTGELRPHRREDYCTRMAGAPYLPDADCPTWTSALQLILRDDPEVITYLQRAIGYCLTGSTAEQVLFLFWGTGSNGKSLLIETIMAMLGDYADKAADDLLLALKSDGHPTVKAGLHGKRLVAVVETADGARLNETAVKELTGSDTITARRMREDYWSFRPTHKLILCTNHKPQVRGTDHAIWRRLQLIEFSQRFWRATRGESGPPELRADESLPEKLQAELPGILAWAVRGCLGWQRSGLQTPESVRLATDEYRSEQDVIGLFVNECCVTGSQDFRSRASDLYHRYSEWTDATGERPVNQRRFGMALAEKGFTKFRNNGIWWKGIGLVAERSERSEPYF